MILLGFLFVVAYLVLGEWLAKKCFFNNAKKDQTIQLHSIASGILLAAVFLEFFHKVYTVSESIIYICVTVVVFTIFYGLTHHVKHAQNPKTVMIAEKEVHLLYFLFVLLHYFVIGALFAHLAHEPVITMILVGIPLLMMKAVGGLEHIERGGEKIQHNLTVHLSVMMAMLGFILVQVVPVTDVIFLPALSFVAGAIFHLIITELFSRVRVNLKFMIAGEVVYGLIVAIPLFLGL